MNEIKFANVLCDTGCLFYGIVDSKFVTKCGFERMKIIFRNMQGYNGITNGVCNEVVLIRFDINGHVENSFCYVALKLKYDLILGKFWMKKNGVQYHPEPERLWIQFSGIKIENVFLEKPSKTGLYTDIVNRVLHAVKKNVETFSAKMADIDKILKMKTIILEHY